MSFVNRIMTNLFLLHTRIRVKTMQELAQNGGKSQHDNFQGAMATLDGLGCQTVDGLGGTVPITSVFILIYILEFILKF